MGLEQKAKENLEKLLDMSFENLDEMSARWEDFDSKSNFGVKNSHDFHIGYIFGKVEHKFISWFYSEFGRSQTDEEYKEFWYTVMNRIAKSEIVKSKLK